MSGEGVVPQPDISVTPGTVVFGTVGVGAQKSQTIEIQNIGQSDLQITSIKLCTNTSDEFTWTGPANSIIPSSSSETLDIIYTPLDDGVDAGCIEINSNDPDQATVSVDVSGEGVVPPEDDGLCFPIKASNGKLSMICL